MERFAKRMIASVASLALAAGLCPGLAFAPVALADDGVPMYRLYNPNSGEHFYTANVAERDDVVAAGWNDEGIGWTAPSSGGSPVYRLYNANGGEHHYTMDAAERDVLVSAGWNDEGIGWSSDNAQAVPLYRQYNPNAFANNHNYTSDPEENDYLVSIGWQAEGVGWYGIGAEPGADENGVNTATSDEPIEPEGVDPNHENIVDYKDNASVLRGASYTVNGDGSVSIDAASLPGGLNPGDVVVLEPTSGNPGGAVVTIDDGGAYDGTLSGGAPDISAVYDRIDVEAVGTVAADGFAPESDVEVVGVESVSTGVSVPGDTTVLYPQSEEADGAGLSAMAVTDSGKSTSKLTLKYKGLTFSVKPTGTIKCTYDYWGVSRLYVSVKMEESLSTSASLSSLLGGESVSKKIGSVTFATSVPGLFLEGSVWFHLSADGSVTFSLDASQELGAKYTRSDGIAPISKCSCSPKLSMSAELSSGIDFVGTVKMCALKIADPSLEARFALGADSSKAKTRSNGMVCNDISLRFTPSISIGKHEGLLKDVGISYSKQLASKTLKKWHMENGNLVNACTWDGSSGYAAASELVSVDMFNDTQEEKISIESNGYSDEAVLNKGNSLILKNILQEPFNINSGHLVTFGAPDSKYASGWKFWTVGSIDSEPGTTYVIKAYDSSGNVTDSNLYVSSNHPSQTNWWNESYARPYGTSISIEVLYGRLTIGSILGYDLPLPISYESCDSVSDYPLHISHSKIGLLKGTSKKITYVNDLDRLVYGDIAKHMGFTYSIESSNDSIVKCVNGQIEAVQEGKADIAVVCWSENGTIIWLRKCSVLVV